MPAPPSANPGPPPTTSTPVPAPVRIPRRRLRIGVDVGGTNTDGVVLDPSPSAFPNTTNDTILAWAKKPTTANPSAGIAAVVSTILASAAEVHGALPGDMASVTIGTTAFVNAVVERDGSRLEKVAVLRLCGSFSKHVKPCVDWPGDLSELVLGYYALVRGGLEVDGSLIGEVDEGEVVGKCREIREMGIRCVVVNGVFSPLDTVERQEERVAEIVRREIPGVEVVCSKEVASIGFLERENAAILNAAILRFARKTIRSFQEPFSKLGLVCPVFITQNDGTLLSGEMAARLPIRTFSSGPTNSMRGAAFLIQNQKLTANKEGEGEGKPVMVVDIGGTTTDVGLLLANGFPRQQAAYSELAGVRMNFSCPDIKSIGLGGGSIVRQDDEGNTMTVGPDSVGYMLQQQSLICGGDTITTTDIAMASKPDEYDLSYLRKTLGDNGIARCNSIIKQKLEKLIDTVKTSPEDITVILVGGGAVIASKGLKGASEVLKPHWAEVANAIGAAIARVSAVVDTVKSTESKTNQQLVEEISKEAIQKAVEAGAAPDTVKIVEIEILPLQYIADKTRFVIRAAGDCDFSRTDLDTVSPPAGLSAGEEDIEDINSNPFPKPSPNPPLPPLMPLVDFLTYRPRVQNRVWYISETDLDWISIGCYILGTGGGGSPYPHMILLRELLRAGAVVRVVNPYDVPDSAAVGGGGGAGSPTVAVERLQGDEMMQAQTELYKICPQRATHMIALEIGGGNGLQGMTLGASTNMDIPCVDGDWMGRAYPTKWQTTPVVFNERTPIWSPIAIADGNGNVVMMPTASSDLQVERIMRAALSMMGSLVGCAEPPVTGAEMKRWVVEHTISQSWRIGRAVAKARLLNRVDNVAETILEECGGPTAGRVLFKGKIVGVERTLRMGHVYGECIIEGADVAGDQVVMTGGQETNEFKGRRIKIPFKNENIAAIRLPDGVESADGSEPQLEKQEDVLAIVPDLITVIDAQNGEAIGTPEYRYGLLVIVLGIAASDKWTGSERGIELGGPRAFGFDHLKYEPLGTFVKPVSVIDEFDGPNKWWEQLESARGKESQE